MVVLVGLPGSGKSTWAEGKPVLSSDHVRGLLSDDVTNQKIHKQVFATVRYLLRTRVALGCPVTHVDATHLSRWERRPYLRMKGVRLEAVFFDTPVEVCKERNQQRERVVPDEAIDAMALRLEPPSRAEGFARVIRITPQGHRPKRPGRRGNQNQ